MSAVPQNAPAIVYAHAPFSYYFHTPRTQTTQLHFQGTKVINDRRTSLQLLKEFRHLSRCRETRMMAGDIMVFPFPWTDLGHRSHHMFGTDRIASLCRSFSVSVVRIL